MTAPTLRIVDASMWQDIIDWSAVKADGVTGAICKSSEGVTWRDPQYDRNWVGILRAELERGCYHFSRSEYNDPQREAAWFLSVVPHLQTFDIVALDIETGPRDGSDVSAWALEWLEHVADVLRTSPLVYTFRAFAETRLRDPALARYDLWCADYGGTCPARAGVWNEVALWQRTDQAQVRGIRGRVDESVITRDLAGLRQLGKSPGPHKIVVLRDMMLRSAPEASHVYQPVQMVFRGATLDVVAPDESGWVCVSAGRRTGWVLGSNTRVVA